MLCRIPCKSSIFFGFRQNRTNFVFQSGGQVAIFLKPLYPSNVSSFFFEAMTITYWRISFISSATYDLPEPVGPEIKTCWPCFHLDRNLWRNAGEVKLSIFLYPGLHKTCNAVPT